MQCSNTPFYLILTFGLSLARQNMRKNKSDLKLWEMMYKTSSNPGQTECPNPDSDKSCDASPILRTLLRRHSLPFLEL
jgi:hypothetical protein